MNESKGCGGNANGTEGDIVVAEEMDVEAAALGPTTREMSPLLLAQLDLRDSHASVPTPHRP